MASIQSAITEHLEQAFSVFIPHALQARMDLLPASLRHTLLAELFRLAAQAGQERELLPRPGPVMLQFLLAGCDVQLELNAPQGRLTLVALERTLH